MTATPPAPAPASAPHDPPAEAIPWEALEDLAAGALPAAHAAHLCARIAAEPALASAFARVTTVQGALASEGLFAFPASLAERIAADLLAPAPLGWGAIAWRAAASVALAASAWAAWVGGAPSVSAPKELPAWARAPVDLSGRGLLGEAPALPAGSALWAALGACALLAGGVVLARRWGTGRSGTGGLQGAGRSA
jgi:hypothetical protein